MVGTFGDYKNKFMLENQIILKLDSLSKGRIYSINVGKLIIEQINSKGRILGKFGTGDIRVESEIAFDVKNPRIINNNLIIDITVFNTIMGKALQAILFSDPNFLIFRFSGVGKIEESTDKVYDYFVNSANALIKEVYEKE